ncbi:hypothetical protein Fcan01_06091 [Folsomia candida]|uniref:Uncharacterized protein n=1 Tax=Folsomia candida TaxID=158441 RepID=A0A226ETF0_FOLCA|nr:hypothetical protein Fcan01_06091 [Folsomia candida]
MLSSKKGPSAHILIGAICFLIHICDSSQGHKGWKRVQTRDAPGESTKSGQTPQSRFLTSEEEPGILLPADDKYNFVGQDDATTETIWRTGRSSSPLPPRTIVSTNSYSIRPGSSSNSGGSTFTVNAKPVPMVTTGSSYTVKTDGEKYFPYLPKNSNKSTVFVKNNCFGHRCPPENSNADRHQSGDDDEWKSYHYVLNKGVKHNNNKQRKMYNSGDRPSRRNNEADSYSGLMHEMSLSVPFRVDPTISKYDTSYPHKFARRVLRTTTPSSSSSMSTTTPGWVKLQPILPDQYDPFTLKSNKNKLKNKSHQESNKVNPASQFANRRGVELDPDSFAERWGWGDQNNDNNGGGSRYPAWLQGVDNNNNNNNGAGGSDRDRDWVKLEPIPVAAVSLFV